MKMAFGSMEDRVLVFSGFTVLVSGLVRQGQVMSRESFVSLIWCCSRGRSVHAKTT